MLLIFAPGNENRGGHFADRHQFLSSVVNSARYGGNWFLVWLKQPLLWTLTIVFLPTLGKLARQSQVFRKVTAAQFSLLLVCWPSIVAAFFFTGFWAMGKELPLRAINTAYFVFLIGWVLTVIAATSLYVRAEPPLIKRKYSGIGGGVVFCVVGTAAIVSLIQHDKVNRAYQDLLTKARPYDMALRNRYVEISRAKDQDLELLQVSRIPKKIRPRTIMVDDIRGDQYDFRNDCYADYFGIQAIKIRRTNNS